MRDGDGLTIVPASLSRVDLLLLFGAGVALIGGIGALLLGRSGRSAALPAPGVARLSAPTAAIIGLTLGLTAHQLAAPVFGWWGLRGPMGALLALGVVASVGSVWLDVIDRRHSGGDEQ